MSTLRDAMSHAALGWVKPELDETLRQVRNEVEYFVEDPADGSRMRFCAGYLHQVQGTLRMVELYAPAMVAEEMEQLANAVGAGQVPDRDEACATLMRGSVLLPDYLERLQNGHRDIPIVLLPLLNEIRAARGAPGINESVLFAFAPESASATEAELDHARGSLSGRNRELLDTVGNAVKEELLRIKDALDLHLRTGGEPGQLQTQVNELGAVADTLGMMGLGVARGVVVQQRDALTSVVQGEQQIDEGMLLDIAGALLYVDASLDDQVAHLGASGSGEEDPSAVEGRRTLEVLAHEAIANFAAAREHFVAFIETNWNHQQLDEVPRLLGEVAGALRMLDLPLPADYLQGVRQYIAVELIGRQRVPSGRQLDTLADAMASLEYYLEALRERRPGREDILDITRTSLETLRYWPLPAEQQAVVEAEAPVLAVTPEPIAPIAPVALEPVPIEVTPAAPAPGEVAPAPLPDFTFDPAPAAVTPDVAEPAVVAPVAEAPTARVLPPLVFEASTAPVAADAPKWTLAHEDRSEAAAAETPHDEVAPTFASFDPVQAEGEDTTGRWDGTALDIAPISLDGFDAEAGIEADLDAVAPSPITAGSAFDPVAAESDSLELHDEPIEFTVDDALHNAGDVLSLNVDDTIEPGTTVDVEALPAFLQGDAALEDVPAAAEPVAASSSAPVANVQEAVIGKIELDDESARFLAELDAAAAQFSTAPAAAEPTEAAPTELAVDAVESIEAGFEDDGENIDQDIRDVFIEEFDEELVNLGNLLPVWRAAPDNMDRLRPIRRVFHTLKGSGRLVGARTLGEFSWKIEGMLNRVLDGTRPASPAVVAMVTQAYEVLPQLNAALRDGSRVHADLQAMQGIADRVAAGEETFHVPLQRPAAAPVAPVEAAAASEPVVDPVVEAAFAEEAVVEDVLTGTPANIDDVLREILEAEVETHHGTLQTWLQQAKVSPQPVTDALLRAVHTMNGAFAMTDVPEITAVTGAAESFIKRSLAADALPDAEGVAALDAAAAAIRTTMEALQAPTPRIPAQAELAARLQALAETLPEARWPALVADELDAGDQDDDADDAIAAELTSVVSLRDAQDATAQELAALAAQFDVQGGLATLDDTSAPELQQAIVESDALSVVEFDAVPAQDAAAAEDSLAVQELTGSDDLSAYFDADLPVGLDVVEVEATAVADISAEEPVAPVSEAGLESVELTGAEDLSQYFDPGMVTESVEDATDALDEVLPPVPAFGEPVDLQQALDDGLTVIDGETSEAADGLLALDATLAGQNDSDAFAGVEAGAQNDAAPLFELEEAPLVATVVSDPDHDDVLEDQANVEPLDFSQLDRELVDIFVEEGKDLLDHCDGLISELRDAPEDREVVAGLQRDLHTLKGGARMAGINAIGDLGHSIESLLEVVAANRTDIDRADVKLLERGFDRLHQMLTRTGNHQAVAMPVDLINAFEQRTLGRVEGVEAEIESVDTAPVQIDAAPVEDVVPETAAIETSVEAPAIEVPAVEATVEAPAAQDPAPVEDVPAAVAVVDAQAPVQAPVETVAAAPVAPIVVERRAPLAELAPLSAPVQLEAAADDDMLARPQQEQVRVRADLLDRLVNHAGEVAIYRSRLEQQLGAFRGAMAELDRTNARLRDQLRRLDLETEAQIVARYQREQEQVDHKFDPLELDRFSTLQQLSRALNESAADLGGLQGVLDDLSRQYDVLLQQQSRVSSELQDGLMRARMVPFDGLVPRLRRVVRQAGQDTGKQVHVTLDGTHGELDRNVLDRMVAPLEHMLRNSVAHGLETPAQRRAAGKPEEGEIAIRLRREGSEIVLEVADDGAGLDRDAIRRRAEQRGLIEAGAQISEAELDAMIFAAGFSTADQVSQLAGRGVGMDVVHNEVRQLGGSVDIHSVRGKGVTFTLRLPQTLAVTQAVFVQIGETTFAVPVASVSGIGRISRERFESANGGYHYGGEEFALHDLGTLVGQGQAKAEGQDQVPLLLVRAGELRAAVAIDQVLGNREVVVKPVGLQIASVPGIYGATITGDGRVVVILDVAPLVRRHQANPIKPVDTTAQASDRQVPLVMVVDDSLTMRKVTGRILERHNFEVAVARDGIEALERLEERVPDLMLLDIEMPRMDGYELATTMRADPRYKDVPIVMITSRSGDKHRQRAFEIGVQRYLGKPYQELDLMRNVYDLLGIARVRE
ncbi:Hpt domain-containing protein [Stenotrophomonas oahuensis]|uniref:histidine kinase n=1 Tax=Stenotrophomonas oahuensis TaxID=3003271 RepID=A0ABY9YSH3_9GAMM|nr:Hpt domain-containing protein [Stenotrophomonas sp. A5586]WNH53123.1 Hpt domain-containing protein [Stenotrophomonas sp. A5586]